MSKFTRHRNDRPMPDMDMTSIKTTLNKKFAVFLNFLQLMRDYRSGKKSTKEFHHAIQQTLDQHRPRQEDSDAALKQSLQLLNTLLSSLQFEDATTIKMAMTVPDWIFASDSKLAIWIEHGWLSTLAISVWPVILQKDEESNIHEFLEIFMATVHKCSRLMSDVKRKSEIDLLRSNIAAFLGSVFDTKYLRNTRRCELCLVLLGRFKVEPIAAGCFEKLLLPLCSKVLSRMNIDMVSKLSGWVSWTEVMSSDSLQATLADNVSPLRFVCEQEPPNERFEMVITYNEERKETLLTLCCFNLAVGFCKKGQHLFCDLKIVASSSLTSFVSIGEKVTIRVSVDSVEKSVVVLENNQATSALSFSVSSQKFNLVLEIDSVTLRQGKVLQDVKQWRQDQAEVIRFLLDQGADKDILLEKHKSIHTVAVEHGVLPWISEGLIPSDIAGALMNALERFPVVQREVMELAQALPSGTDRFFDLKKLLNDPHIEDSFLFAVLPVLLVRCHNVDTHVHCAAEAEKGGMWSLLRVILDNLSEDVALTNIPLHGAISSGNNALLLRLLQRRADPNLKTGEYESTALHTAVKHKNIAAVTHLLNAGVDCNARSQIGTALHVLCSLKCDDDVLTIGQRLLHRGAD
eukprot:763368-Hanusia_phi.AAC.1